MGRTANLVLFFDRLRKIKVFVVSLTDCHKNTKLKAFFFLKCGCLSLSAQYVYVSFEKAGARFTDEKGLCWRGLSHLCKKETCCVSHINVLTKAYIVGLIISGN